MDFGGPVSWPDMHRAAKRQARHFKGARINRCVLPLHVVMY